MHTPCHLCKARFPPPPSFPILGLSLPLGTPTLPALEVEASSSPPNGLADSRDYPPIPAPVFPVYVAEESPQGVQREDPSETLSLAFLDTLLSLGIPTVSSIPGPVRFEVAEALLGTLQGVISHPGDEQAWIRLLIFAVCVLRRVPPSPSAFISHNQAQVASIAAALTFWSGGPRGIGALGRLVLDQFSGPKPEPPRNNHTPGQSRGEPSPGALARCRSKIRDGHYHDALQMLADEELAPCTEATLAQLRALHPVRPPPPPPLLAFSPSSSRLSPSISPELVLREIRSFKKGTGVGGDGLRPRHLLDLLGGNASGLSDRLLGAIQATLGLLLDGRAPLSLAPFVASAPLIAKLKPGGGLRPIAVGLIWRRLASKVALHLVLGPAKRFLGGCQFGVGFSGGAEAIIHSVNRLVGHQRASLHLTLAAVDFSNAFNEVDRSLFLQVVSSQFPALWPWVPVHLWASSPSLFWALSPVRFHRCPARGPAWPPAFLPGTSHHPPGGPEGVPSGPPGLVPG